MSLAEVRPAAKPGLVPSADELVGRARKLAPKLRERALKAERDRNIPRESVEEYIDAGLIHALQPKRWGGYEHDHEVAFDIADRARQIDLRFVGLVPELSRRSRLHPGAVSGRGAARRLEREQGRLHRHLGGADRQRHCRARRLPSRRPLVVVLAGLRHSHWIMIGGLAFRAGEDHPDMRLYLVPVSQLKKDDTWYCAGLRATGSITSVLDNVFVPEHRSVSFSTLRDACSPGSKVNTNPIYRTPFIAVHSLCAARAGARLARGGYADFVQWTRQRYLTYTQLNIAQHVPVQLKVAEIAAADRCGRAPGAARARDRAQGLYRHDDGDAHAAAPRLHLRHAHAARCHGRR